MDFQPRVNTENPDPRIACAVLLDTSASMSGTPIDHLNEGFARFCDEIKKDDLAKKRAEISVITFGGMARIEIPFTEARYLEPRHLGASGATPLGGALDLALDELDQQKRAYRDAGLEYYRPWLFILTDGEPTDGAAYTAAVERVRRAEAAKGVSVFAIGVPPNANLDTLKPLSAQRPPKMLDGTKFGEFFSWLSASLSAASASGSYGPDDGSQATEQIALPPAGDWTTV